MTEFRSPKVGHERNSPESLKPHTKTDYCDCSPALSSMFQTAQCAAPLRLPSRLQNWQYRNPYLQTSKLKSSSQVAPVLNPIRPQSPRPHPLQSVTTLPRAPRNAAAQSSTEPNTVTQSPPSIFQFETRLRRTLSCWLVTAVLALLAAVAAAGDATAVMALVDYSNYTLSFANTQLIATSVSGLALFGGGSGPGNIVDIFNTTSGLWTTASLSVGRSMLAATSVSGLALFGGGSGPSNVVDIFNTTSGLWTTAALSIARYALAATSVSDLALFGGGLGNTEPGVIYYAVDIFNATSGFWTSASLSAARWGLAATSVSDLALLGGGSYISGWSNIVDIFNATTGLWITAFLSTARCVLAATSVSDLALFGGGQSSNVVDIFNATSGLWTTACLSVGRQYLAATSMSNFALFGGGVVDVDSVASISKVVDIFNVTSGLWTTASLTVTRWGLAATSASNMALFGGGAADLAGTNSNAVDIFLSACLSGFFFSGQGGCESCPSGFFCPLASSSPPVPCPPGCFCPARSGVFTLCPAGTHNPNPGASSASACLACDAGSYNPGGQPAPSCTLCPAGNFNPYTGSNSSSSCMKCGLGTYNPTLGANSSIACLQCGAGTYGDTLALTACKPCIPGTSNPTSGVSVCAPCTAGTFSNVSGCSLCTPCSAGTYNFQNGSSTTAACLLCPPPGIATQTRAHSHAPPVPLLPSLQTLGPPCAARVLQVLIVLSIPLLALHARPAAVALLAVTPHAYAKCLSTSPASAHPPVFPVLSLVAPSSMPPLANRRQLPPASSPSFTSP